MRPNAVRLVVAATVMAGAFVAPVAVSAAEPVPVVAASTYTPVTPVRVLDTRNGTGGVTGSVGAGRTVSLNLAARIPATATAVVLNLTGTEPTSPTYVTAFPHSASRPLASSLNLAGGETRANLVTVQVGADRVIDLYNHLGAVHLVADLAGYYGTGAGARFTPRVAERLAPIQLGAASSKSVDLSGRVPASATAVAVNVTGADVTAGTFLTAWPTLTPRPTASTVNLVPGRVTPNLALVPLGDGRRISLYNNAGSVTIHLDLAGFYSPEFGAVFTPAAPARVLDTRDGTGTGGATNPVTSSVDVFTGDRLPDNAIAATMNLTGILPSTTTHVSTWRGNEMGTSSLNLVPGQISANQAVVPLFDHNPYNRTTFHNNAGTVHLVADLAGYFWVPPAAPCQTACVTAWGSNHDGLTGATGLLGVGVTNWYKDTPTPVVGLSGAIDIADRYAARADGTIWSWGPNMNGELGAGWLGGESTVPVQVSGLSSVTAVAATTDAGWALRSDGTVWGWGRNDDGFLGIAVSHHTTVPVQVLRLSGITAIAAGEETGYALRSDGTVWALGGNSFGQLGNGSADLEAWFPVQVSGLTDVVAIASGYQTAYAVRADGTVWSWGWNSAGTLGNGSDVELSRVPVQVSGLTGVVDVTGGDSHAYALRQDGTVWAWGSDLAGQLGSGQQDWGSSVPVQVPGLPSIAQVTATESAGLALDTSGQVWGWGYDTNIGVGADVGLTPPIPVPGLDGVTAIYPGFSGARAVR